MPRVLRLVLAVFVSVSAIHNETNVETCDAGPKDTLARAGAEVLAKTEQYMGELKEIRDRDYPEEDGGYFNFEDGHLQYPEGGYKEKLIDLAKQAYCFLEGHRPFDATSYTTLEQYMGVVEQIARTLHDYGTNLHIELDDFMMKGEPLVKTIITVLNERILQLEADKANIIQLQLETNWENRAQLNRDVSDVNRMELISWAIQSHSAAEKRRRSAAETKVKKIFKNIAKKTPFFSNEKKTKIAKKTTNFKNTNTKRSVPAIMETPETLKDICSRFPNFKILKVE